MSKNLKKYEIVNCLNELGYRINSVHDLNIILEQMGFICRSGKIWVSTIKGWPYTIYNSSGIDADIWHPTIVDEIVKFLETI